MPPELYKDIGIPAINFRRIDEDNWTLLRFIQFLISSDCTHAEATTTTEGGIAESSVNAPEEFQAPSGTLTPITEEPSEAGTDPFFINEDPDLRGAAQEANVYCLRYADDLPIEVSHQGDESAGDAQVDDVYAHFLNHEESQLGYLLDQGKDYNNTYHLVAANLRAGLPRSHQLDVEEDIVELHFEGLAYKIAYQEDPNNIVEPQEGEHLITLIYKTS